MIDSTSNTNQIDSPHITMIPNHQKQIISIKSPSTRAIEAKP